MKELLEAIVKNLVDHPDKIQITEEEDNNVVTLTLRVSSEDMGKVIGKHGRIARAIRTVVKAAAHDGKKIVVEIEQ